MSLRLLCPNGHELIVEPTLIGRKVRCPACKVVLLVSGPSAEVGAEPPPLPQAAGRPSLPPARRDAVQTEPPRRRRPAEEEVQELEELPEEPLEEDEEDRPRRKKEKGKNRAQMVRTNLGLGFHYGKALCLLVFFLAWLFADLMTRVAMAGSMSGSFLLALLVGLSVFSFIATVATAVMGFVGSLLCLWVPAKTGTKPLIITSFSLDAAGVALALLGSILTISAGAVGGGIMSMGAAGVGGILFLLGLLLAFVAWILFMVFLRSLANYVGDHRTGDEAMQVMILLLAVGLGGVVAMVALVFALQQVPRVAAVVLGLLSLGWIITMVILMFRALALIASLRAQLSRRYG